MKKKIQFFILAFIVFLLGYSFQKFGLIKLLKPKAKLEIIGSSVKDFGELKKSDSAVYYFKFINSGKKNLILKNIETRCGCTISEWNNEPILYNEKDSIKIEYDTNIVGPFNRTIAIYSNSEKSPEFFHIKGVVKD